MPIPHVHVFLYLFLFAHQELTSLCLLQDLVYVTIAAVRTCLSVSLSDNSRQNPNSGFSFALTEPLIRVNVLVACILILSCSLIWSSHFSWDVRAC